MQLITAYTSIFLFNNMIICPCTNSYKKVSSKAGLERYRGLRYHKAWVELEFFLIISDNSWYQWQFDLRSQLYWHMAHESVSGLRSKQHDRLRTSVNLLENWVKVWILCVALLSQELKTSMVILMIGDCYLDLCCGDKAVWEDWQLDAFAGRCISRKCQPWRSSTVVILRLQSNDRSSCHANSTRSNMDEHGVWPWQVPLIWPIFFPKNWCFWHSRPWIGLYGSNGVKTNLHCSAGMLVNF